MLTYGSLTNNGTGILRVLHWHMCLLLHLEDRIIKVSIRKPQLSNESSGHRRLEKPEKKHWHFYSLVSASNLNSLPNQYQRGVFCSKSGPTLEPAPRLQISLRQFTYLTCYWAQ